MPMAPVMLEKNLSYFFNKDQYSRVIGSDRFMILTYDYKADVDYQKYGGIMHKYPTEDLYSGRPQVIYNDCKNIVIKKILEALDAHDVKAIVNTSYNFHGCPIVFSEQDALDDFKKETEIAEKMGRQTDVKLYL